MHNLTPAISLMLTVALVVGNICGWHDAKRAIQTEDKKILSQCEGVPYRNLKSGKVVCFKGSNHLIP